jgi:hypothetical protein
MDAHDHVVQWAKLNRRIIAERAAAAAHGDVRALNDLAVAVLDYNMMEKCSRTAVSQAAPIPSSVDGKRRGCPAQGRA